ncbi:HAD-IG family 5'-nucleotidase [Anaeromyxobacter oryzae]|uniref:Haloacid dehalogenase n=1 Tax=Anaeromyxobacter oryzae TaxID=2918170 RepID=A0ABM7X4G0_9BACT|nr:HAD-IG family 5'-nucleotidase [Anaeromyxobacter oryzae]BDG06708.1 haloacid dehalogenase [Anaeromyxobacter oryzae]
MDTPKGSAAAEAAVPAGSSGVTAPAPPPGRAYDDPRIQALLELPHAGHREVPRARQIFVNRNLRMDRIELVGFDMDYTLAIYHLRQLETLAFEMTLARMIEFMGYPPSIGGLQYDPEFVIRGVVVDKQYGNIFKMDRHNHVGRAYHGRRQVPVEMVRRLYRDEKIHLSLPRFAWIDTLFALPEACLFALVIELLEGQGQRVDYHQLFDDIREAIDTVHRDGSLKAEVKKDLDRYLVKDPDLGPALHRLRSGGKKLFLLTNSLWDYTDAVMSYVLDGVLAEYPSWRNYFDAVITGAAKPAFFSERRPLLALGPKGEPLGEATALERGKWYEGGDLSTFERLMGIGGDRVLYVGDHIYGDILRSKKSSLWRTCMVVQEIESEIAWLERNQEALQEMARLEELRLRVEDEIAVHRAALNVLDRRLEREEPNAEERDGLEAERRRNKLELEGLRRALRDANGRIEALERAVEEGLNPYWGLTFKEGNENSRFGEQTEVYACLYTSRASNFVFYSPMQYFRSPRAAMPHERTALVRISPYGDQHGAPVAGDRPSKASKASR